MEKFKVEEDLLMERAEKITKALTERGVSFDVYSAAALLLLGMIALAEIYKISYKEAAERATAALKFVAEAMDEKMMR